MSVLFVFSIRKPYANQINHFIYLNQHFKTAHLFMFGWSTVVVRGDYKLTDGFIRDKKILYVVSVYYGRLKNSSLALVRFSLMVRFYSYEKFVFTLVRITQSSDILLSLNIEGRQGSCP